MADESLFSHSSFALWASSSPGAAGSHHVKGAMLDPQEFALLLGIINGALGANAPAAAAASPAPTALGIMQSS